MFASLIKFTVFEVRMFIDPREQYLAEKVVFQGFICNIFGQTDTAAILSNFAN